MNTLANVKTFYQGKKVLVTGGDGFIGSHLCEHLVRCGAEVTALVQYNAFNRWGWLDSSDWASHMQVVAGDIRDPHQMQRLVQHQQVVFHLAALIAIPYSYQAPQSYIDTNVTGTLNVCQAALQSDALERLVQTSTSEVYGTALQVPIDESHPLQPQSPYSASKMAADAMALSHHASFELPVIIARPFNTYGPRQSARAVIPTIIGQLAAGQTDLKLGDTSPTRDFNFVDDTALGMMHLAMADSALGQTVNLGSNREISIGDTVQLIADLMQVSATIQTDAQRLRPSQSEVFRLWCDNGKQVALTGYQPQTSLEEGLQKTIDWFTVDDHLAQYKVHQYNV